MPHNDAYIEDEPEGIEETHVDLQNGRSDIQIAYDGKPYAGMSKEVLLKFSRQKKFVYARNILTTLVFLTMLVLLSMIIAFIAVSPPCQEFWQTSPVYEVAPRSFKDSDGDGVGDLIGLQSKLDYLSNDLGVKTIVLKELYKSAGNDYGFDVTDFKDVDEDLGTVEDVVNLVLSAHEKGMYVSLDFIPNHTSDKHDWFIASCNKSHQYYEKYKDYYIWVATADGNPPNNWQSVHSSTSDTRAWSYNSDRGEWYYHAFYASEPDLNYRNPEVRNEMKDVLRFWLEKNVDGFRVDSISYIYEAEHRHDQIKINESQPVSYENLYPDFTKDQGGVHDLIMEWRELLDEYSTEPGVYRFMEVETDFGNTVDTLTRYYGNEYTKEADLPANNRFMEFTGSSQWTGTTVGGEVEEWLSSMPTARWPNWRLGSYHISRLLSRVDSNEQLARCTATLTNLLSGTAGIYYGEEIGMTDITPDVSADQRDAFRSAMQWNNESNAGFTDAITPLVEVNEDFKTGVNVETQLADSDSMLHLYKELISLRSELVFLRGSICIINVTDDLFVFVRELSRSKSMLIAINFSPSGTLVELEKGRLNLQGTVKLWSNQPSVRGEVKNMDSFQLAAHQAVVIEYDARGDLFAEDNQEGYFCFVSRCVKQNGLGLLQNC